MRVLLKQRHRETEHKGFTACPQNQNRSDQAWLEIRCQIGIRACMPPLVLCFKLMNSKRMTQMKLLHLDQSGHGTEIFSETPANPPFSIFHSQFTILDA